MLEIISRNINLLFKFSCILMTIILISWCAYKYLLDDDVTLINFKPFHDTDNDIYPSVMLCFYNPFVVKQFNKYGPEINSTSKNAFKATVLREAYKRFLQGGHRSEQMAQIHYEDVTLDINKYFLGYHVRYSNGSSKTYNARNKCEPTDGRK